MRRRFFGLILLLVLTSCQAALPVATEPPTPQVLALSIATSLDWMRPALADCAVQHGLALAEVRPGDELSAQVSLRWGDPHPQPGYWTELGQEEWALVVSANNPLRRVESADVPLLLSGQFTEWGELLSACSDCMPDVGLAREPLHVFGYGEESDAFPVWASGVLKDGMGSFVGLPDAATMYATVAGDPTALGFLPARWVDERVRRVEWDDASPIVVLAWTAEEPQGAVRDWLACVQRNAFPTVSQP